MLARMPFTIQYAREETPREHWHNPVFIRINYVITGAWGVAFLIAAIAGYYGDAVLKDNNNIWTGWIIQIGAELAAVQFTTWHPRYAQARALRAAGQPLEEPQPPVAELLLGISAYLVPVGVISLATSAAPWFVGVGFIVAGTFIGGQLRNRLKPTPTPTPTPAPADEVAAGTS